VTQFADDYEAQPRSLVEIEALACSYLSRSGLLEGDWIDVFEVMSSLGFRDEVLSTKAMMGAHSLANAKVNTISMSREMRKGLRDDDLKFRYVWGHEIGHLAMHRGPGLKARVAGVGNKSFSFIPREKSAEFQAWIFSRALFLPRSIIRAGLYDDLAYQVGLPDFALEKRIGDIALDAKNALFKR
jgi:hypothetical protein